MFFTRFRPFGVDWQKKFFTENFAYRNFRDDVIHSKISGVKIFSEKKNLQIDSKWFETRKKEKTADPSAAAANDRHRLR